MHYKSSVIFLVILFITVLSANDIIYHQDGRKTPKIVFEPEYVIENSKNLEGKNLAKAYLNQNFELYGLTEGLSNLKFVSAQKSLIGTHYHYQQFLNGKPIARAKIVVSVSNKTKQIYRVHNNIFPVKQDTTAANRESVLLSLDQLYKIVWNDLRVHGELLEHPNAQFYYTYNQKGFKPVYIIDIAVSNPYGYFRHTIDAVTGEIISVNDRRIKRLKRNDHDITSYRSRVYDTKPINFSDALFSFQKKELAKDKKAGRERSDGTAFVFDPDPRTATMNPNLHDKSDSAAFEHAYTMRVLKDIAKISSGYVLSGPWVNIIDFEEPHSLPSIMPDGNWTAKRGNNAFNDAMTYFHIDQNQRYIQSLGFNNIQYGPIEIDTDGLAGDDNSYFLPDSNRLSFGHGCVDDNEDADVILHEYGHAINYSINNQWEGGDTGTMGEGFGDYWGGSYSITTENGANYKPNEIYTWDGHSNCWDGRIMNVDPAKVQYDPARSYEAHVSIGNGVVSDELWSTPLFQSLLQLINQGHDRSEVDRIILEAQFGFNSSVTMREMAKAIVDTAKRLYPGEKHAQVFFNNFKLYNILE